MTLAEFLKREGLSDAGFAAKCRPPMTRAQVWFYKNRRRTPRADKVASIQQATGGKVTTKDLIASE